MITAEKSVERVALANFCFGHERESSSKRELFNDLELLYSAANLRTFASTRALNVQQILLYCKLIESSSSQPYFFGSSTSRYIIENAGYSTATTLLNSFLAESDLPTDDSFGDSFLAPVWESVPVSFEEEAKIKALLADKGMRLLYRTLDLIKNVSSRLNWPLKRLLVNFVQDPDVEDWEYVLIRLVFQSSFEEADACLHVLYGELDRDFAGLNDAERQILARDLFYDIEASNDVFKLRSIKVP